VQKILPERLGELDSASSQGLFNISQIHWENQSLTHSPCVQEPALSNKSSTAAPH
jgi:hypothetical protein